MEPSQHRENDQYGSASVRRLDARSLRGLAHPLRMRILDILRLDGPSNSTELAKRVGESTGTVSWHLRQLAHHGFIEDDPGRGNKRERWWRAPSRTEVVDTGELGDDVASRTAVADHIEELLRWSFGRVSRHLRSDLPAEWRTAGTVSEWTELRLSAKQLAALTDELTQVVERHIAAVGDEPSSGSLPVVVQLQAFPYVTQEGPK